MTARPSQASLETALSASADGAAFSDCGQYRYLLWRTLSGGTGTILFIGLNPSTADASTNDPTIRRMIGFAQGWGHARLLVANVYAYRATRPVDLFEADAPVGPDNSAWLLAAGSVADRIVCCWGNQGHSKARDYPSFRQATDLQCLAINDTGAPAHPLYQPAARQPARFEWPA